MSRSLVLAALVLALAARPAAALETPHPGLADPRIKTVDYDALQVIRIVGAFRTATQVLLGDDETILHVALGDTSGWDVVAEKNILFVKPKTVRAPTNLIVTAATAAGETRHYTFELATRAGPTRRDSPDTFFVVRFRYPAQERARITAAISAEELALQAKLLQLKLDRGVVEGTRNLAYDLQGDFELAPSEVTDNGRFTVLRFPGAQLLPAIYTVGPTGTESLAPLDVRGEFVVLHQTASQIRLRRGRAMLCIFNRAPQALPEPPQTGAASREVERVLKPGARP